MRSENYLRVTDCCKIPELRKSFGNAVKYLIKLLYRPLSGAYRLISYLGRGCKIVL